MTASTATEEPAAKRARTQQSCLSRPTLCDFSGLRRKLPRPHQTETLLTNSSLQQTVKSPSRVAKDVRLSSESSDSFHTVQKDSASSPSLLRSIGFSSVRTLSSSTPTNSSDSCFHEQKLCRHSSNCIENSGDSSSSLSALDLLSPPSKFRALLHCSQKESSLSRRIYRCRSELCNVSPNTVSTSAPVLCRNQSLLGTNNRTSAAGLFSFFSPFLDYFSRNKIDEDDESNLASPAVDDESNQSSKVDCNSSETDDTRISSDVWADEQDLDLEEANSLHKHSSGFDVSSFAKSLSTTVDASFNATTSSSDSDSFISQLKKPNKQRIYSDDSLALFPFDEDEDLETLDEELDEVDIDDEVDEASTIDVEIQATETDSHEEYDMILFMRTVRAPPEFLCRKPMLPPALEPSKKLLILDLDETLVHASLETMESYDFFFHVLNQAVYVRLRPHVHEFLEEVSRLFEVLVFTASQEVYADKLLNLIDTDHQLSHRLFRDSCCYVQGSYIKELSVLGRDLANVIIVDNSPVSFSFQIDNGIPIDSWYEDVTDTKLLSLLPFLRKLAVADDVRPLIQKRYKLRELVETAL